MKLSAGKRVLMFFHWLLTLLIVAAFAVYLIVPDFMTKYYDKLVNAIGFTYVKIIGFALLVIYAVLAVLVVYLIFKRKKRADRGFITMDASDNGKVRIAISAIEQMVRQSVGNIDGITDMRISIDNQDDAIVISVNASIISGSHVPTITMNMQRAIRQFVETNCGVAVRMVSVTINSVTNQAEAPRRWRVKEKKQTGESTAVKPPETYIAPVAPANPAPVEPEVQEAPEEVAGEAPVIAPVAEPEEAPAFEAPEPEPYDFDKPYESEFAKDLAAMKAKEAAQAEALEADAAEAPTEGEE